MRQPSPIMKNLFSLLLGFSAICGLTQCTSPGPSPVPLSISPTGTLEAGIADLVADGLTATSSPTGPGAHTHHEYVPPRPPRLYYEAPADATHHGDREADSFPHPNAYTEQVYR